MTADNRLEKDKTPSLHELSDPQLPHTAQSIHEIVGEGGLPAQPKTVLTVRGTAQGMHRLQQLLEDAKRKGEPFKVAGVEVLSVRRATPRQNR